MGFINAAAKELMRQKIDWPRAPHLEAGEFADQTVDQIRWLLGVGEEDGRRVAEKIWQGLREKAKADD